MEDLEKASETTNHENGRLRAQVERLNMELKEYRKRLSLNGTGGGGSPPSAAAYSSSLRNFYNNSQHNFHFAFPKFGDLPGSNFINNGSLAKSSSLNGTAPRPSPPSIPGVMRANSAGSLGSPLPSLHGLPQAAPNDYVVYQSPTSGMNGIEELNGLFSPSILEAASRSSSTDYLNFNPANVIPEKHGSMNSQPPISITTSPSTSSMSNHGLDSSCGTTPEPSAGSPDTRKGSEAVLNTISEEFTDSAKIEGMKAFSLLGG